jgi:hypothetical protein
MSVDVKNYCRTCDVCQRFAKRHPQVDFSGEFKPKGLFYSISIDYCGPFTTSRTGNRYILVVVEHLTRWVWARAVPSCTGKIAVQMLREDVLSMIGMPVEICSDRGSHFTGDALVSACSQWGIKLVPAPSYVSEHNALVERVIQSLVFAIEKSINGNVEVWDEHLPLAVLLQRVRIHTKTQKSAAELMFGQQLRLPGDPLPLVHPVGDQIDFRMLDLELLAANRYEQYLKYGDKHSKEVVYKIGTKVLLLAGELRKGKQPSKLDVMYSGPFIVKEKVAKNFYRVVDLSGRETRNPVHVSLMKPYYLRDAILAEQGIVADVQLPKVTYSVSSKD